ncbi:MAG TPA: methyltransferase domain-containing protein [Pyrinomonadaceae bacterium]|nr:methyltransferase domain-containing protein [Pyrinomonadaceae bacterium]
MDAEAHGDGRYFTRLAAAFVRGRLGEAAARGLSDAELVAAGLAAGLRLHKFKRNAELPRVRRVLGILRGLQPATLLDVGSGRGTFLWPLLDAFPDLMVTAVDTDARRVADINAVRDGGVPNLRALRADAAALGVEDKSVDVLTALEVLEHLASPQRAAAEAMRVARGHVVASVPSKEDDNPEHIHLFDRRGFESLLLGAGARGVKVDFVLNHMIAVARV